MVKLAHLAVLLVAIGLWGVPFLPNFVGYVLPTAVMNTHADTSVNISMDANGTVYIMISGFTVEKFVRSQVIIGYYNSSHIYVSYMGLYVESPETDLVPALVEIYNGTSKKVYTFNATSFSNMGQPFSNTVTKTEYYYVADFTSIRIVVYNMTDPSNPVVVFEGELPPPPQPGAIWSGEYVSYLAVLIPIAILILLAGRGSTLAVGMGLVVYGVVVLLLPYLRLYLSYTNMLSAVSIILGIIIIFFSGGGE